MAPPGCETTTSPLGDTVCVHSVCIVTLNAQTGTLLSIVRQKRLNTRCYTCYRAQQQVLGCGTAVPTRGAGIQSLCRSSCCTCLQMPWKLPEGQSHSCSPVFGSPIQEPLLLLPLSHNSCHPGSWRVDIGMMLWRDLVFRQRCLTPKPPKQCFSDCAQVTGGPMSQCVLSRVFHTHAMRLQVA